MRGHHSETHFSYKYFGYSSSRSDSFYYIYILFNYFFRIEIVKKAFGAALSATNFSLCIA